MAKVYLAGKILPVCWRHGLVDGLSEQLDRLGNEEMRSGNVDWPLMAKSIHQMHDYVGPYFTGAHKATQSLWRDPSNISRARKDIMNKCHVAVKRADVVFAWLTDTSAHGTLFELGYAIGLGKPVFMASPSEDILRELWFPASSISRAWHAENPDSALKWALSVADADIKRGDWFQITVKWPGPCVECGGSIPEKAQAMVCKGVGLQHIDCYRQKVSDPKIGDTYAFNSEVLAAVRSKNAELEKECTELTVENAMLRQELGRR